MTTRPAPFSRPGPLLAALAAGAVLLAGCGSGVTSPVPPAGSGAASAPAAGDVGGPVTVSNCGRQVTVAAAPDAVIGMHPSQTEMLLRLGLDDRIVGQAQTAAQALPDDLAARAADVPVISTDAPPAREALLAAGPDFVYAPTTYEFSAEQGFASLDQLDRAGVAAYVATGGCAERRMTGTVDDLFVDLENLGRIFGVESTAAELTTAARSDLDAVAAAIDGVTELRVAQVYVDGTTLSAIGAGVEFDIMTRAGADPVFTPDDPQFDDFFAASLTPEALAAAAPEALVFAVTDAEHERSARAYLTATFPDLPAVRDGRLIAIENAQTFPGTLGNVAAVRHVAESLYPDRFGR